MYFRLLVMSAQRVMQSFQVLRSGPKGLLEQPGFMGTLQLTEFLPLWWGKCGD